MAFEIPDHYHKSFTTNVELLLQQKMPHFMGTVTTASYSGEAAQVVKQFGEVEFQPRLTRSEDTTFSDIEHKQRWVFPETFDLALPVDKIDEIKMLNSPLSPYVEAMRAGWARKWDQTVIDAFFATSKTGKNGGTNTAFPADAEHVVPINAGASGDTGLNIEKLIQARELLTKKEVDLSLEQPHIAVTSKQISDMLRSVEATSADYAQIKRLETGEIDTFMGFRFVRSERLPAQTADAAHRRLPVWVPSGIVLGQWDALDTKIGERPDKKYITQVFMQGTLGATRTQEGKVVEIICQE